MTPFYQEAMIKTVIIKHISRMSNGLNRLAELICVPTAIGFIVILLVQIFIRFVIMGSIAWSLEVIQLCFLWSVFMGVSIAWKNRSHIMFHFVIDRLPSGLRQVVLLSGHVTALVFFIYMVVYGLGETVRLWPSIFEVLHISEAWAQLPVPLSGLFMGVHTLDRILEDIQPVEKPV